MIGDDDVPPASIHFDLINHIELQCGVKWYEIHIESLITRFDPYLSNIFTYIKVWFLLEMVPIVGAVLTLFFLYSGLNWTLAVQIRMTGCELHTETPGHSLSKQDTTLRDSTSTC